MEPRHVLVDGLPYFSKNLNYRSKIRFFDHSARQKTTQRKRP